MKTLVMIFCALAAASAASVPAPPGPASSLRRPPYKPQHQPIVVVRRRPGPPHPHPQASARQFRQVIYPAPAKSSSPLRPRLPLQTGVASSRVRVVRPVAAAAAGPVVRSRVVGGGGGGLSGFLSSIARRFGKNLRLHSARPSGTRPLPRRRPVHHHPLSNHHRRHFKKQQVNKNVPNFFYKKAEDIPGYEKFTLDEVIHAEDDEEEDVAKARSDDVKEEDVEFVDDVDAKEAEEGEKPEVTKKEVEEEEEKEEA